MRLLLKRTDYTDNSTIGELSIDGEFICYTLEDRVRYLDGKPLSDGMTVEEINSVKEYGTTAIPTGAYKITMDVVSPRFGSIEPYKTLCNGKVPRLVDVKGYEGVLIHIGNYPADTDGCILVGTTKSKDFIGSSTAAFNKLYPILKEATDVICITIINA